MAEIGKSLKGIWLKSMEAISNTASSIASNTRFKVDEMNLINRRRDILTDFGAKCYELWKQGERFPAPVEEKLQELSNLDEALQKIRAEKQASGKNEDAKSRAAARETPVSVTDNAADEVETTADGEAAASDEGENDESKNSMSEKIDNAMDAVGATFKKLGSKLGDGIEALTKAMKPRMEEQKDAEDDVPMIVVDEPAEEAAEATEAAVSFAEDMPAEPVAPVITIEDDEEPQV